MPSTPEIHIVGLPGMPEVAAGADLPALVLEACARRSLRLRDTDILVFTQKIVSKAEGRLVRLAEVSPSSLARAFAHEAGKDPRAVEVVLSEARRVVKMDRGILITETRQGLVCAHTGVDASNVPEPDAVVLLPEDPDGSAAELRRRLEERAGVQLAVIISDTFGRPWREGLTNVAIGVSGIDPLLDYRGERDPHGRSLSATVIAVADELAAAAELVMGKLDRVPVALIRGYRYAYGEGRAADLVRSRDKDLFR